MSPKSRRRLAAFALSAGILAALPAAVMPSAHAGPDPAAPTSSTPASKVPAQRGRLSVIQPTDRVGAAVVVGRAFPRGASVRLALVQGSDVYAIGTGTVDRSGTFIVAVSPRKPWRTPATYQLHATVNGRFVSQGVTMTIGDLPYTSASTINAQAPTSAQAPITISGFGLPNLRTVRVSVHKDGSGEAPVVAQDVTVEAWGGINLTASPTAPWQPNTVYNVRVVPDLLGQTVETQFTTSAWAE